jgi:hypothetical protein
MAAHWRNSASGVGAYPQPQHPELSATQSPVSAAQSVDCVALNLM